MLTVLASVAIVAHAIQGLIKRLLNKKKPQPWNGYVDSVEFYNTY
jgi:hypothetical protein